MIFDKLDFFYINICVFWKKVDEKKKTLFIKTFFDRNDREGRLAVENQTIFFFGGGALIRIMFVKSKIVLSASAFTFSILADTLILSDAIHSFSCWYSHT